MSATKPAALLGALLLLAGCKGDLSDQWKADPEHDRDAFLGVVVPNRLYHGDELHPHGLRMVRILRDSPADDAGLRAGDVLLRFGARPIVFAADLESALTGTPGVSLTAADELREEKLSAALQDLEEAVDGLFDGKKKKSKASAQGRLDPNSRIELTVLRGEEELLVEVDLRPWGDYRRLAQERLDAAAAAHEVEVAIPFLFDYSKKEIPADTWLAYRGRKLTGPVVTYEDVDVLPLLVASLFRWEEVPLAGASRYTFIHWPLRFTFDGDSEVHEELSELGEGMYDVR